MVDGIIPSQCTGVHGPNISLVNKRTHSYRIQSKSPGGGSTNYGKAFGYGLRWRAFLMKALGANSLVSGARQAQRHSASTDKGDTVMETYVNKMLIADPGVENLRDAIHQAMALSYALQLHNDIGLLVNKLPDYMGALFTQLAHADELINQLDQRVTQYVAELQAAAL